MDDGVTTAGIGAKGGAGIMVVVVSIVAIFIILDDGIATSGSLAGIAAFVLIDPVPVVTFLGSRPHDLVAALGEPARVGAAVIVDAVRRHSPRSVRLRVEGLGAEHRRHIGLARNWTSSRRLQCDCRHRRLRHLARYRRRIRLVGTRDNCPRRCRCHRHSPRRAPECHHHRRWVGNRFCRHRCHFRCHHRKAS